MSTMVESEFIETRTLTLKVSSHPPETTGFTQDNKNTNLIDDSHSTRTCWDFGNINSHQFEKSETSSSYVPPKSLPNVCLELCTENLGSESGSDSDHSDILSLLSTPHIFVPDHRPKQSKTGEFKIAARIFPPPLTTMRGVNPIRVRPKREGGRLVIQAVEEPAPCKYFRSERSHGRLRLCFWDNSSGSDDAEELEEGNGRNCVKEMEDEGLKLNVREEEETIGNDGGVEIGNQIFQRRSNGYYCKESGSCNSKDISNWKPFWVAT